MIIVLKIVLHACEYKYKRFVVEKKIPYSTGIDSVVLLKKKKKRKKKGRL